MFSIRALQFAKVLCGRFLNMAKYSLLIRFQLANGEFFFFLMISISWKNLAATQWHLPPPLWTLLQLLVDSQYKTGYKVGGKQCYSIIITS